MVTQRDVEDEVVKYSDLTSKHLGLAVGWPAGADACPLRQGAYWAV